MKEREFLKQIAEIINKRMEVVMKDKEVIDLFNNYIKSVSLDNEDDIDIYAESLIGTISEKIANVTDTMKSVWDDHNKGLDPKDIPTRLDMDLVVAKQSHTNGLELITIGLDILYVEAIGEVQIDTEAVYNHIQMPLYLEKYAYPKYCATINEHDMSVFAYVDEENMEDYENIDKWEDD